MKASKRVSTAVAAVMAAMLMAHVDAASKQPAEKWSVEVTPVDAGALSIAPEFKVAIYENLLIELGKSKEFSAVLRSGDRTADGVPNLLILKTTVESYTPGSEAKRAVTTVAGATKLRVRTQLCNRDGQVVVERVVDGSVRFFGGNLRATHSLASHVAKAIEEANLPAPAGADQAR